MDDVDIVALKAHAVLKGAVNFGFGLLAIRCIFQKRSLSSADARLGPLILPDDDDGS